MSKCDKCPLRMYYAKLFDMHFDYVDCPFECEYKKTEEGT